MVNKDLIEKALLLGVVRTQNWDILVENSITIEYFSFDNQQIYTYIKGFIDNDKFPELQVIVSRFDIDNDILNESYNFQDLKELCKLLQDDYLKYNLKFEVSKLNEYTEELNKDPRKYIDRMEQVCDKLKNLSYQSKAVSLFDDIETTLQLDSSNVISTGFPELDAILVGWKRGEELVTFVARTNQGKSWLGLKFALSAAFQGENVGIYSGEMSKQQLQERILCCAKKEPTTTKEEALVEIKERNIDIKIITQKELRGRANINDIEEFIVREHLSFLVIDQLSLMDDIKGQRQGLQIRQQYNNISMDLFSLSIRHNLPIILLAQSNRQGSDNKNGPQLENIAESDAVAQNSTRVITMKNDHGILTLNIAKNRYGAVGGMQKYEVDFMLNKYKAIIDFDDTLANARRLRADSMFMNNKRF